MNVLLVLDNENAANLRILVTVSEKRLQNRIIALLEENRGKEAFNILKSRAQVKAYLPRGSKLPVTPEVTLIEDML